MVNTPNPSPIFHTLRLFQIQIVGGKVILMDVVYNLLLISSASNWDL